LEDLIIQMSSCDVT